MLTSHRSFHRRLALGAALALTGCASWSPDGGLGPARQAVQQHQRSELAWARTDAERDTLARRVAELLSQPLTADAAVQVALFNNRGLQAEFAELGLSEAELMQASRLPNPALSFARLRRGDERELDRGLSFNLAALLALPLARQAETRRFEQTQSQVAMQALALAAETRKAYYQAVAATQTVQYMQQVRQAAEAGAELGRRMADAGNWSKAAQAREQSFQADAALAVIRAEQAEAAAREQLLRLLGLTDAQALKLPDHLPELPATAPPQADVEQAALNQRLDLQAARARVAAVAKDLGLTRTTRFINTFELGGVHNSFSDAPASERGYEIRFELPLFDWGGARVARAEALYMQAVDRAAQQAAEARSEVRQAYRACRSAHEIARRYRDEILPLRKRIADENLLRYNGMLIGVFELLADARAQIASVNGSIEALRDYWLAQSDLEQALVGKPTWSAMAAPAAGAPADTPSGH